jgi:hypothetical protein
MQEAHDLQELFRLRSDAEDVFYAGTAPLMPVGVLLYKPSLSDPGRKICGEASGRG